MSEPPVAAEAPRGTPAEDAPTRISPLGAPSASAPLVDPLIGMMLGNFRIVRPLGVGGMGTVYLGEHTVIGSKVAVKFLHPHLCADPSLVARFLAEAKAVNLIAHHHIVSIYDLSLVPPDRYFLVMEHLEGRTLAARLQAGHIDLKTGLAILVQICEALTAAHSAGIVHRDLKPENIFLIRSGTCADYVKILDFGIAKILDGASQLTLAGRLVGTPEYMPPEQWTGEAIDGRTDLYVVGMIAFLIATGRLPFDAGGSLMKIYQAHMTAKVPSLRELDPTLPEALDRLVAKALARRPEDRCRNAEEMRAAFQAILDALEAAPAPSKPPTDSGRALVFPAQASWTGDSRLHEVAVADLSRGGLFVRCAPPHPEVFARVHVTIVHSDGKVSLDGEVVHRVGAEQARAWGMEAGFAVQIREGSLSQRQALDRLSRGLSPVEQVQGNADDPAAERILARHEKRPGRDLYGVLGLANDCVGSEVHRCARQAIQELVSLASRMSSGQRDRADAVLEKLHAARTILGTPKWRAGHDAEAGNFRGVARCLQAGLAIEELAGLRQSFLSRNPDRERRTAIEADAARVCETSGRREDALFAYEAALSLDPLSLELQRRYWALKRTSLTPAP